MGCVLPLCDKIPNKKGKKKSAGKGLQLQLQEVSSCICKEEIKLTLQQTQGFFTGIFIPIIIPDIIMAV